MDNFTLQLKALCLVSILIGVMGVLIPSCRLKKAFDSFCVVVIAAAIILMLSSLKSVKSEFDIFDFDKPNGGISTESSTAEVMLYSTVIEKAVNSHFLQSGLSVTVEAECESTSEGCKVTSFTLIEYDEAEKEAATEYLAQAFGGIPVYYKEEKNV
jgi:hypothetical protein